MLFIDSLIEHAEKVASFKNTRVYAKTIPYLRPKWLKSILYLWPKRLKVTQLFGAAQTCIADIKEYSALPLGCGIYKQMMLKRRNLAWLGKSLTD